MEATPRRAGLLWLVVMGACALLGGCSQAVPVPPPEEVAVTPEWVQIGLGESVQLEASAIWAGGTVRDVTGEAQWASANETIAVVEEGGTLTGVGRGSTRLTASHAGVEASAVVVVEAGLASCRVLPEEVTLPSAGVRFVSVEGTYEDGTVGDVSGEASWEPEDESVAVVREGAVVALCPGTTRVSAFVGEAACEPGTVTVTDTGCETFEIQWSDDPREVLHGDRVPLSVSCTRPGGSAMDLTLGIAWSSSDPSVAAIGEDALGRPQLEAVAPGTAQISATLPDGCAPAPLVATADVVVVPILVSIRVAPVEAELRGSGETVQLTATCHYRVAPAADCTADVHWIVAAAAVATFSEEPGEEGLATALAPGTTSISARLHAHSSNRATLRVLEE